MYIWWSTLSAVCLMLGGITFAVYQHHELFFLMSIIFALWAIKERLNDL